MLCNIIEGSPRFKHVQKGLLLRFVFVSKQVQLKPNFSHFFLLESQRCTIALPVRWKVKAAKRNKLGFQMLRSQSGGKMTFYILKKQRGGVSGKNKRYYLSPVTDSPFPPLPLPLYWSEPSDVIWLALSFSKALTAKSSSAAGGEQIEAHRQPW